MKCMFCGRNKEPSKEHIIPEALGNKDFVTYKVCKSCSNKLDTSVDSYGVRYINYSFII